MVELVLDSGLALKSEVKSHRVFVLGGMGNPTNFSSVGLEE